MSKSNCTLDNPWLTYDGICTLHVVWILVHRQSAMPYASKCSSLVDLLQLLLLSKCLHCTRGECQCSVRA